MIFGAQLMTFWKLRMIERFSKNVKQNSQAWITVATNFLVILFNVCKNYKLLLSQAILT